MAGSFLVVLIAAALTLQVATVKGDNDRICFATSTTEYCVCPNTCDCLPVLDDGTCSKNQCDCNGQETAMRAVEGTLNKWPAGGWNGADWSSLPGSDFWYPGEGKHWWPGTTKDGSASEGGHYGGSDSGTSSSKNDTSGDGDPPYNPDLKDPTQPGADNNSSGDNSSTGSAIERNTSGNPARPPPPGSKGAADAGGSGSSLNTDGQGTGPKTATISGAAQNKAVPAQVMLLALVCLLSSLWALLAC